MATTGAMDDDHWPSLPPIRTSATPGCLQQHASDQSSVSQDGCTLHPCRHGAAPCACVLSESSSHPLTSSDMPTAAPFDVCSLSQPSVGRKASNTDLVKQSSCCSTRKKTHQRLLSCLFCTKPTSSPCLQRRCTPKCMRKNGAVLRSMAFLFPGGGLQSFYSSPTGKAAQLSGAFPRTLSGKLQAHYTSPQTPGNHPFSGKFRHFSSPRTPGSENLQCLSAPRTPASGKVQHYSGAIPSPRTPFASGAASPSSARRRKSSLFMPPISAIADKKKAVDHADEPTSPHVTCIGRVRRQTHCRKPHAKDIINSHAHSRDSKAKKRSVIHSKNTHSGSGVLASRSGSSKEALPTSKSITAMEACKQKFGKNQLQNLYKVHGFGDECADNESSLDLQGAGYCKEGDDRTANENVKDLMHLDPHNYNGKQCFVRNVECIDGSLQEADHGISENIRVNSIDTNGNAEFTGAEHDHKAEPCADSLALCTIVYSENPLGLQQEVYDTQPQCLIEGLSDGALDKPQGQMNHGLHSTTAQSIGQCRLLIRSNSGRTLSDLNTTSSPIS